MSFVNRLIDSLASKDVIDLYFIKSDLFDVNLTEEEITENACLDVLASTTTRNDHSAQDHVPIGKRVL